VDAEKFRPSTKDAYLADLQKKRPFVEPDAESIVSDTTTDSSVSSDASKATRKRRRHKKWRLRYAFGKSRKPWPYPSDVVVWDAVKRHKKVVLRKGFLSKKDIEEVVTAAKHPSVPRPAAELDRSKSLKYNHDVSRFEVQLRLLAPDLYTRLLSFMVASDRRNFGSKCKFITKVYPEVEYISYETGIPVGSTNEPDRIGSIEPHVDNQSVVSLVAMLSDGSEFAGGVNCFTASSKRKPGPHREVKLEQGDAVVFRGERLLHWITPVTQGRRVILQIELSRL